MSTTLEKAEHTASHMSRNIEEQTGKIPSDWFLLAALGSIVLSLVLHTSDKKQESNFVGHWAPTFLALGLYTKMIKMLETR